MKKIAIIYMSNYDDWPMGGMLTYIKNIIPHILNEEEYKVDIWGGAINNKNPLPLFIGGKQININVYTNIRTENKKVPNFVMSFCSLLLKGKAFNTYDIIYSHTAATTLSLKITTNKKFIVHHQHGLSYKEIKGYKKILNLGYTLAQIVANVNLMVSSEDSVKEHAMVMKKWTSSSFYQIGSPINYTEFKDKEDKKDRIKFIYTGRIDSCKNILLLLESFQIFLQSYSEDAKLMIVGDGPEFEVVKEKISCLNLDSYVDLLGKKSNIEVIDLLKEADIFVFPSEGEGMPLSILEAFNAGLPVVGFDVIGVNNLIIPDYNGLIAKNITAVDFSDKMIDILKSYKRLSVNCNKCASQYDSIVISKKICEIIEKEYELYKIKNRKK